MQDLLIFNRFYGQFCPRTEQSFLRPGSKNAKPPVVSRPAPPPPKPIPRNPNLEFRGYYKFDGDWKIALFDKAKNQGYWLSKGESIDGLDAQVESFNPNTDELRLSGGMTLKLKDSDKTTLPVPSGQAKPKPKPIPNPVKPVVPVRPGVSVPPPKRR